jgi:hypothetical protein
MERPFADAGRYLRRNVSPPKGASLGPVGRKHQTISQSGSPRYDRNFDVIGMF